MSNLVVLFGDLTDEVENVSTQIVLTSKLMNLIYLYVSNPLAIMLFKDLLSNKQNFKMEKTGSV